MTILTLLSSWNADWTWVTSNILLSLAFVRFARPFVQVLLQRHGWVAFAGLVCILVALSPIAAKIVDYGSEGWLWALFGVCQRICSDRRSATLSRSCPEYRSPARAITENENLMRLLACLVAAVVYIWHEQREYSFPEIQFAVFTLGVAVLSLSLYMFRRGPNIRIQPPEPIAGALRFIGRHTLEIYAIQLVGSELIVALVPNLAP